MTTLTDRTIRSTRKPRRCVWCPEMIEVGAECHYRAYRFDGIFQTDYLHPECYAAMCEMDHGDLEDGFLPHEFKRGSTEER